MFNYAAPLEGLFENSKTLVLDFSKIDARTPDNENFSVIFKNYQSKALNPRLPENRQRINNEVIDATGYRYLIGQYGEDRTAMLSGTPAGNKGRVMHMAIDVFSKDLEFVFSPCDGEVVVTDYEPGFGQYGNYIIIKPDDAHFYLFFGHLSNKRPAIGSVARGQQIAQLGDYTNNENGGWSRHLHIQILNELPEPGQTPNGYSSKEMFKENILKYPNPLDYFPEWRT